MTAVGAMTAVERNGSSGRNDSSGSRICCIQFEIHLKGLYEIHP
jgi:hypothetical protein